MKLCAKCAAIITASILFGCIPKGPQSPYQHFYESQLANFHTPSVASIRSPAPTAAEPLLQKTLEHPIDAVWRACIEVGVQYWGILDLSHEESGVYRMVVVVGSEPRRFKRGIKKPVDRWLAVLAEPSTPGSTELTIGWINPETGEVSHSQDFALLQVNDQTESIVKGLSAKFLNEVQAALVFEEAWLKKFPSVLPRASERGIRLVPKRSSSVKQSELLEQWGNLESAVIRRNRTILDYPELQVRFSEVAKRLNQAAGKGSLSGSVYIVASENDNAVVTANGDLFLSTGLLKSAENIDELAGLIGHELAHLHQNHHLGKQVKYHRTRRSAGTLSVAALVVGGAAYIDRLSPPEPTSASFQNLSETFFTGEEVLVLGALGGFAIAVLPQLILSARLAVGDEATGRYTQSQEFLAD